MKLVASMIVHNELGRYLDLTVEHLLTYVDEVRALDDGSTDGSFEWLSKCDGVHVLRNPGPSFYEYESKARNELIRWTLEGEPTYVLSIDADEFVTDPTHMLAMLRRRAAHAYYLSMEEVWGVSVGGLDLRVDGQWGPRSVPVLWAAPAQLTPEWEIPDRKLACGREPAYVRRARARPTRVPIYHFGWANRSERERRFQRYMVHDQGQFHQDEHLQSIMWPDDRVRVRRRPWPGGLSDVAVRLVERADETRT